MTLLGKWGLRLTLLLVAGSAQAGDRVFTLVNETQQRIVAVYASPNGANNWRRDLLNGAPLRPGQSRAAVIRGGKALCAYDLRIEIETRSGVRTLDRVQDLCALDVLTLTP